MEPYPAIPDPTYTWWVQAVNDAAVRGGVQIVDYFVIDHDWNDTRGSWGGIRRIRDATWNNARSLFGVIFWAAGEPRQDRDWHDKVIQQGQLYQLHGIFPNFYSVDDWTMFPLITVPDTVYDSYTSSVLDFANRFVSRQW